VIPSGACNAPADYGRKIRTLAKTARMRHPVAGIPPVNYCGGTMRSRCDGSQQKKWFGRVSHPPMKNTRIPHWENGVLSIGFQFFNLFNHANFGFPDNSSSDAGFGQISYQEQAPTSILGSGLNANVSARMVQLKAQLQF
jgi:hypothetical protein